MGEYLLCSSIRCILFTTDDKLVCYALDRLPSIYKHGFLKVHFIKSVVENLERVFWRNIFICGVYVPTQAIKVDVTANVTTSEYTCNKPEVRTSGVGGS